MDEILAKHERRKARRERRKQLEEQQAQQGFEPPKKSALPTPYDKWAEFSVYAVMRVNPLNVVQDSDDSDEELVRKAMEQPNSDAQAFLDQIERDAAERAARRKAREAEGDALKNQVLV